jgi:hypothetical protein
VETCQELKAERNPVPPTVTLLSLDLSLLSSRQCFCYCKSCIMYLHHLFYLIGQVALTSAVFAPCYAPDGSPSPGTGYLPCVATLNVDSMCCVLNSTALLQAGETIADADTCLPNGLCLEVSETTRRAFCTDKTWKSPNCLDVCTGGAVSSFFQILVYAWCYEFID